MQQVIMFSGCLVFLLSFCCLACTEIPSPPHIIFILADDLGWNDVSYHGSPEIPTPNIDALAASGIILKRHYTAQVCTPSRASLMTGRYPTNTGLQHHVILAGQPLGLPLNLAIMPQYLKRLGYATHGVGKWHLGYHKKDYTPTYRGFDTFFGYWNGEIDHYDYTHYEDKNMWGMDLHDGLQPIKHFRGPFAADVFTEKAEEIIRNHNESQPLFLYLSQTVPHVGNPYQRLQAPPEHVAKFMYIKDTNRRIFAGSMSTLDESLGKVFAALDAKCMLNNSIVLFVSDNGGETNGSRGDAAGSNWPLRGGKLQLFEGGIRTPAVIWSPLLQLRQPRISTELIHISDWLPTLYAAAGGNVRDLGNIDGMNMWEHFTMNLPSPRNEILINVDPQFGMSSLIRDDYKLVNGIYPRNDKVLWYGPSGRENFGVFSMDAWVWRNGSVVKDILQRTGRWLIYEPDSWRQNAAIDCGSSFVPVGDGGCDPKRFPCLFNIREDPCEYHNIAWQKPEVVQYMLNRIRELNSSSVEPLNPEIDSKADPRCHGFTYVPWRDPEYASQICGFSSADEQ